MRLGSIPARCPNAGAIFDYGRETVMRSSELQRTGGDRADEREIPGEHIVTNDEDDIVAFFRALPAARRREYDSLAELDRRFGEDVEAELRTLGRRDGAGQTQRGTS